MTTAKTYHYIVVGAGSAGCVVANRLSADPRNEVLLLEAGGPAINPWLHIPVGYFKTIHNPRTDWCYKTEADPGLNGRSVAWPRGKVLGGSSAINGLLYVRGQPQDYDHWHQLGNADWSWSDVLPYFTVSEDQQRGADPFHGVDGPLAVSDMRARRDVCEAFIQGAAECGIPPNDDFNGAHQEGAGYFQLTARKGLRCSTATAFLRPVRGRRNLTVVTHAHVLGLEFTGSRVCGVSYHKGGRSVRAEAAGEVVLSAGAIGSPQLLQVSGIGAPDLLSACGVRVHHALPGVGENLQDHLQLRLVHRCTRPTLNDEVNHPLRKMWIGLEYMLFRRGPMSMGASQVAAFAKTRPELGQPDVQFHFQPLSADKPGEGLHRYSAFTSSVCQLRPESRGHVRIHAADPAVYPLIQPNYLSTLTDQKTAVAAIRLTRSIADSAPMRPFVAEELVPGQAWQSDEELLQCARDIGETIYHPVGTCKMGSDPMAVVDERLRVRGVPGLRVADASIMPTIPSGNTNAPAIMVGEKAAALILQDDI